ncbi:N-methyl-L-tryptophan oxidase [Streptomyces sp. NPDC021356]|uniref:N-methyl-L-tryptophan oxidase n=1 Tax=Streptomyces sp. NPDC021356 TaxID=3154900 RepID=UPI0033EBA4C7
MKNAYDVIVVGLGGMGSAAARHLARRGRRVLGLERFGAAHAHGSSHGGSRIYRQAYAEDPAYVPLLLRARELWDEAAADSGQELFTRTGGLMIGRPDAEPVAGTLRSAREWGLQHEVLDAAEIRRRFPTFTPSEAEVAVHEDAAGVVRPELTVRAHLDLAAAGGADLRFHEPVLTWEALPAGGVAVTTAQGRYHADRLVLAPGAWAPGLLPDLVPLRVERRVMYWFAPRSGVQDFTPDRHPIYVWAGETEGDEMYGFPALDGPEGGVKVAFHSRGEPAVPESLDRTVHASEIDVMRRHLSTRLPALAGEFVTGAACMYVNTADEHFVVSRHPAHEDVVVACGFSGHGFKFVPVIGEILADLAVDGTTRHPIALFDPARLRRGPAGGPRRT